MIVSASGILAYKSSNKYTVRQQRGASAPAEGAGAGGAGAGGGAGGAGSGTVVVNIGVWAPSFSEL